MPLPENRPGPPPAPPADGRLSLRRILLFILTPVLLIAGIVTVVNVVHETPEEVVADFFRAITDGDVEGALAHVSRYGFGVPYGQDAAFLRSDAIAGGWDLLDVRAEPDVSRHQVGVTIGNATDHLSGDLKLQKDDGEWKILDPFIQVEIPGAAAFTYTRINGRTVVPDELYRDNAPWAARPVYKLLPGLYTFFPDAAGVAGPPPRPQLLLPKDFTGRAEEISLPETTFTDATRTATQRAVDDVLDDCAASTVLVPPHCPFGLTYPYISHGARQVDRVRPVGWSVADYPVVRIARQGEGLGVTADRPGGARLTATGIDGDSGKPIKFTAECTMAPESFRVALGTDGVPQVTTTPPFGAPLSGRGWYDLTDTCAFESEVA